MTRRRWVYPESGEPFEVSQDYCSAPRTNTDAVLYNDRAYQDMGDARFTSRAQHREYMKQHGVTTTSDFKDQWRNQEAARLLAKQAYDPARRADIAKSIHTLQGNKS